MSVLPTCDADALTLLRLYADWGVDCAVGEVAIDRAGVMAREMPVPRAAGVRPERRVAAEPGRVAAGGAAEGGPGGGDLAGAADISALVAALEQVPLGVRRTAMHTLGPVHVEGASVMVIGEVPDADEDRSGVVFAGAGGVLLGKMLGSIGLTVEGVSRMAAIPWRPPGGRDATPVELAACLPGLQRAIALCRPERLVLLGLTPVRMVLGMDVVLNGVRGRWARVAVPGMEGEVEVLPMRHPMQLSASATARRDAWKDLLTLAETLGLPEGG